MAFSMNRTVSAASPAAQAKLRYPARNSRRCIVNAQSSPLEGFINNLTKFIASSPLNEGKIKLAIAQAGDYNESEVQAKMQKLQSENPVMVYSFSTCPFCKNAKQLLDNKGVAYKALELDTVDGGYAIRAELAKSTKRTSMPNIFIGGSSIGGCNDGPGIMTLEKEGKLDTMLSEAMSGGSSPPLVVEAPKAEEVAAPTPAADDVPENVAEAREWIAKWKGRTGI